MYRSKPMGGFDPFNPLPPADAAGKGSNFSSGSTVSFSVPAAVGGAGIGYVWCTSGCVWAPVAAGAVAGVVVPMISGTSKLWHYQSLVLWGGVAGAAVKLMGARHSYQYIGILAGAAGAQYQYSSGGWY